MILIGVVTCERFSIKRSCLFMMICYVWICGIVSIGVSCVCFFISIMMTLFLTIGNVNLWFWLNSSIHLIFGIIETSIQWRSLPDDTVRVAPILYGILITHILIINMTNCWAFLISCDDIVYLAILWGVAIAQMVCNIPMIFVLRYVMKTVGEYQTRMDIANEQSEKPRLSLDL